VRVADEQDVCKAVKFAKANGLKVVGDWLSAKAKNLDPCIALSQFVLQAPKELAEQCKAHNNMACLVTATAFVDAPEQALSFSSLWTIVR
jgi:hypothetical protein